ncbi:MAG: DEAD/DEAH box helicase family protein [Desulfuromonadaceae bacterium]|nr:DEAD/DEAH box helicase family protein [Desulfuromonadaceae bacterium]
MGKELAPSLVIISSWLDFTASLSGFNNKQKGDAFEVLAFHYLQLHPVYATQLETVWLLNKVPADVSKKLNLPTSDEGIDLIARTKEGSYWAIQCKYREDIEHSLTRRELATFTDLAFGVCKNIELALVCTTADRFSHKLALHGERLTFLAGNTWRELDTAFFELLHNHLAHHPIIIKPSFPRPHQQEALNEAVQHFVTDGNERGKLIMPCGSGKSLTGWWLAEQLRAKSVLVAVPSLSLVKQTLEVWARESVAGNKKIRWIAVCSDDSVVKTESDDAAVLVQDLGVRVHTNSQEIAEWLKPAFDGITVVFTTYQSGRAIAEAACIARFDFGLGILDEAHKTVGKKGSLFDHLLHDENITIHRRVFMTATERRYRGDSDNILSMDDPQSYGDTFHLLSFKSALECNPPILSDYKIITVAVTRSEIAALVRANLLVRPDKGEWNADLEAEMLASLISLRKAMQKYPIRHAVSFHASIARARAFKESQQVLTATFPEFGSLETFHVTGKTPTAVRKRELDAFAAADRSLVTNARCLTEGVDVPGIDCVLFADPKRSTVDIVQAVGRALRPAPGKDLGYVVIPVLVDDLGTPEQTPFDSVLMVLRALAANDERIVEYFRTISQGRQYAGRSPVEFAVPDGVAISADEFVKAIELQAWSRLAKLSWRPFEEAREFARGLGLNNAKEWYIYCKNSTHLKKLPEDIPVAVDRIYIGHGWTSWGDWLGSGTISNWSKPSLPFEEAREFARNLKLSGNNEWRDFCNGKFPEKGNRPLNIPSNPDKEYQTKGWINWGDWIGTGTIAPFNKKYRPFEEARKFAQSLGLQTQREWQTFCHGHRPDLAARPEDISSNPQRTYKNNGWEGYGDWLGTGRISDNLKAYRSFEDARTFVHSLALKGQKEWRAYSKGLMPEKGEKPKDIPATPEQTYECKGWAGYKDWLGKYEF